MADDVEEMDSSETFSPPAIMSPTPNVEESQANSVFITSLFYYFKENSKGRYIDSTASRKSEIGRGRFTEEHQMGFTKNITWGSTALLVFFLLSILPPTLRSSVKHFYRTPVPFSLTTTRVNKLQTKQRLASVSSSRKASMSWTEDSDASAPTSALSSSVGLPARKTSAAAAARAKAAKKKVQSH